MQSVLLEFPWCENKLSQLSSSLLYAHISVHGIFWTDIDMAADICFKSTNTSLIWAKILVHKISRICQEQIGRPRCSNHIPEEMALPGWAFHLVPISVTGSLHFSQPCDRVSCGWQLFLRLLVLLWTETILILPDWNFYYEDAYTKMILHSINAGQRGVKQLLRHRCVLG